MVTEMMMMTMAMIIVGDGLIWLTAVLLGSVAGPPSPSLPPPPRCTTMITTAITMTTTITISITATTAITIEITSLPIRLQSSHHDYRGN